MQISLLYIPFLLSAKFKLEILQFESNHKGRFSTFRLRMVGARSYPITFWLFCWWRVRPAYWYPTHHCDSLDRVPSLPANHSSVCLHSAQCSVRSDVARRGDVDWWRAGTQLKCIKTCRDRRQRQALLHCATTRPPANSVGKLQPTLLYEDVNSWSHVEAEMWISNSPSHPSPPTQFPHCCSTNIKNPWLAVLS